jgi:hypothetical protein
MQRRLKARNRQRHLGGVDQLHFPGAYLDEYIIIDFPRLQY